MAARGPYRKGEIRRREILLAALEVFSRRGYRSASIREIAESVGLTQPGLLHYFRTKEELFVEVLRVRDQMDEQVDKDIIEAFRRAVRHNADVPELVHLFVTISAEAIDETHPGHEFFRGRYERLIAEIRDRIQVAQEAGEIARSIDATEAARMFIAVVDGMQIQWLLDPEHTDMSAVVDLLWSQLLATGDPPAA